MAIYDLFLNNPRTRAARYQGSRAEQGAMRQTSAALQNRAANPAAAGMALANARSDQRAANAGMIAQAQAADEAAKGEGVQQLVGTGLNVLGSVLPFATMGMGQAAKPLVDAGMGAAQQGLGQALGNPAGGPAPQPSAGETAFHGFSAGRAYNPLMQGSGAPGSYAGLPTNAWNQYGQSQAPAAPAPLGGGVPEPVYVPQAPQSAMPAERQGSGVPAPAMPVQAPATASAASGGMMPESSPLMQGRAAPIAEQPPSLPSYAASLAGQAPVQGALSPGQYRVQAQPLTAAEQLLEMYLPGLGTGIDPLLGLFNGAR